MDLSIFKQDEFFVDQKVRLLRIRTEYKVYDKNAKQIGRVMQKMSGGMKALSLFLNKQMLPFHLDIEDNAENVLVSIHRGWTFWMSKIEIQDNRGKVIGYIKQKWAFMKPTFEVFDARETKLAEITGDWKAWNFVITDVNGKEIGKINKKWAGVAKEVFTQADKYHVTINPEYKEDSTKVNILAAAITIDMVLKQSK